MYEFSISMSVPLPKAPGHTAPSAPPRAAADEGRESVGWGGRRAGRRRPGSRAEEHARGLLNPAARAAVVVPLHLHVVV